MCIMMDGSEKGIPVKKHCKTLSDNKISVVFYDGMKHIYKRSIPYLIENEFSFLTKLMFTGYVPHVKRFDKYTLKIQYLGERQRVRNGVAFVKHCERFLELMKNLGIRHGDLTQYAIIVRNDHPYFIDWSESRWADDPAPDKRPEGDRYWLNKTILEMTGYDAKIPE